MATPAATGDELAPFILRNVESGEKKGAGAYGTIYKVTVRGVPCIAKRLHENLVNEKVSQIEKTAIQEKFRQECVILSKLKHPNIVHFVGVHYGRNQGDLSLVMEKLDTDLGEFLDTKPNIPLSLKLSILLDVSYGLLYLHTLSPKPIIHRDLTASNILLTSDMRAKIADLGVSKVLVNDLHAQVVRAQTKAPGTQYYMPPEALSENPQYGVELDIFSYGHLALYTTTQVFPQPDDNKVTPASVKHKEMQIAKREASFNRMGRDHCLCPLITRCLQDRPKQRPTISELHLILKELSSRHLTHEKTKYEVIEDFDRERQGLIEKILQQQKEIERMQKQHQQRLEAIELVAESKDEIARKFESEKEEVVQELDKAQEEVRAKTSQVKQYKKQVDQLKDQVDAESKKNVELSQENEKLTKENQKLTKKFKRKSSDKGFASPDQRMVVLPLEKKLAETESLYEKERDMNKKLAKAESLYEKQRDENKVLREELEKLRVQKEELYEENVQLMQRLQSPSVPPVPPRDARKRSATVPPILEAEHSNRSPHEWAMPQVSGQLNAKHQALRSQEKIKQQLQQQFSQQREVDTHCAMTELLVAGGSKFVADGHGQLGQPVRREGQLEATQRSHPTPAAIINPHSQSDAEPSPSPNLGYPQGDHSRSNMVSHPQNNSDEPPPFDPNLVCPKCGEKFREFEIQKFRRHVLSCQT